MQGGHSNSDWQQKYPVMIPTTRSSSFAHPTNPFPSPESPVSHSVPPFLAQYPQPNRATQLWDRANFIEAQIQARVAAAHVENTQQSRTSISLQQNQQSRQFAPDQLYSRPPQQEGFSKIYQQQIYQGNTGSQPPQMQQGLSNITSHHRHQRSLAAHTPQNSAYAPPSTFLRQPDNQQFAAKSAASYDAERVEREMWEKLGNFQAQMEAQKTGAPAQLKESAPTYIQSHLTQPHVAPLSLQSTTQNRNHQKQTAPSAYHSSKTQDYFAWAQTQVLESQRRQKNEAVAQQQQAQKAMPPFIQTAQPLQCTTHILYYPKPLKSPQQVYYEALATQASNPKTVQIAPKIHAEPRYTVQTNEIMGSQSQSFAPSTSPQTTLLKNSSSDTFKTEVLEPRSDKVYVSQQNTAFPSTPESVCHLSGICTPEEPTELCGMHNPKDRFTEKLKNAEEPVTAFGESTGGGLIHDSFRGIQMRSSEDKVISTQKLIMIDTNSTINMGKLVSTVLATPTSVTEFEKSEEVIVVDDCSVHVQQGLENRCTEPAVAPLSCFDERLDINMPSGLFSQPERAPLTSVVESINAKTAICPGTDMLREDQVPEKSDTEPSIPPPFNERDWLDRDMTSEIFLSCNWEPVIPLRIKQGRQNKCKDTSKIFSMSEYVTYVEALFPQDLSVLREMPSNEQSEKYSNFMDQKSGNTGFDAGVAASKNLQDGKGSMSENGGALQNSRKRKLENHADSSSETGNKKRQNMDNQAGPSVFHSLPPSIARLHAPFMIPHSKSKFPITISSLSQKRSRPDEDAEDANAKFGGLHLPPLLPRPVKKRHLNEDNDWSDAEDY
ncbi:hypothetical protein BC829DRAFT_442600 [Chytridium lagenaria]|nr:hypothetical protein BC829DRAFT_442600 [Chytridium lagenaria]